MTSVGAGPRPLDSTSPPRLAGAHSKHQQEPRPSADPAGSMPSTLQEPTPPHLRAEESEHERGREPYRDRRREDPYRDRRGEGWGEDRGEDRREDRREGRREDRHGDRRDGHRERGRSRPRSRSHDKAGVGGGHDRGHADHADGDNSSNSEGPARKRRRSRKGLDKKFECPHAGCGKSYSRAEHLHRHQLNHTPKQIYMCDFPGCERHFVRLDLCNRHRDRHTAKGSSLSRKDPLALPPGPPPAPGPGPGPGPAHVPASSPVQDAHPPAHAHAHAHALSHPHAHPHPHLHSAHGHPSPFGRSAPSAEPGRPGSVSPETTKRPGTAYSGSGAGSGTGVTSRDDGNASSGSGRGNGGGGSKMRSGPLHTAYSPTDPSSVPMSGLSSYVPPPPRSATPTSAYASGFPSLNGGGGGGGSSSSGGGGPGGPGGDYTSSGTATPSAHHHPLPASYHHSPSGPPRPSVQTHGLYDVLSPVLTHQPASTSTPATAAPASAYPSSGPGAHTASSTPHASSAFVATQNFPASFGLPPSNFVPPQPAPSTPAAAAGAAASSSSSSAGGPGGPLANGGSSAAAGNGTSVSNGVSMSASSRGGRDEGGSSAAAAASTNNVYMTGTTSSEYDAGTAPNAPSGSELMMLSQMSMPNTMPMFGTDSILQKSPHVGLPEDFMVYLFNSTPQEGSPVPMTYGSYSDFQSQYYMTYTGTEMAPQGYFPPPPQRVMSVTNLLDQDFPESALISEEKAVELFDLIRDRFHEDGHTPLERRNEFLTDGDRTDDSHLLSRKMMQTYIVSYWVHFSDQVPILHRPTFAPDRTPNLLLIAIMTIGAACLDKTHGQEVIKAGAELSNFLAWHLRWELFMDSNFRPPAKLWVFQTLLLLELYEKMFSTRELHERAHIHHATTITLMRRGRSLLGKSAAESPPNPRTGGGSDNHSSRHSSTFGGSGGSALTEDHWWNNWITNEATRRTAFAAFVLDSIHATMFGHSTVMVAHEMRLPLPCDDKLWKATSGADVGRAEAQLQSDGTKAVPFLEGIKKTLSGIEVKTNAFGRTILMAGLLSVTWHMNQRDLQVNSLGGSQALGGRDKWRGTLTRAFDSWKSDYDKALALHRQERERERAEAAQRGGGRGQHVVNDPYTTAYPNYGYGGFGGSGGLGGGGGGGGGLGGSGSGGLDGGGGGGGGIYGDDPDSDDDDVLFESRVVLHHLAHMATHVDVVDLQMYARAKRLLGRAIGANDLASAQRRMKDVWAPTAKARDATYYAIQFLCSVLLRHEGRSPQAGSGGSKTAYSSYYDSAAAVPTTYSARDDVLLNRPWVLYFAALVVWSYGHAVEGPTPGAAVPETWAEQVQEMREYLHQFGSLASPDDLKAHQGINRNIALLLVLKDTFSRARWELLHEGATLLGNCVQLNLGQMV